MRFPGPARRCRGGVGLHCVARLIKKAAGGHRSGSDSGPHVAAAPVISLRPIAGPGGRPEDRAASSKVSAVQTTVTVNIPVPANILGLVGLYLVGTGGGPGTSEGARLPLRLLLSLKLHKGSRGATGVDGPPPRVHSSPDARRLPTSPRQRFGDLTAQRVWEKMRKKMRVE